MKATKTISNTISIFLMIFVLKSTTLANSLEDGFTLSEWSKKCFSLPEKPPCMQLSAIESKSLYAELARFKQHKKQELLGSEKWVTNVKNFPPLSPVHLLFSENNSTFVPFVQKVNLNQNDRIVFFGDLHGCVHSLLRSLNKLKSQGVIDNNFKIVDPTLSFMFLGDFVDRGIYGVEVIYTIMRLYNANPKKVLFTRGNHEDRNLNLNYGFEAELKYKFEKMSKTKRDAIYDFYDYLPAAIYLGCDGNYIQCCHGGMEMGYNPQNLLNSDNVFEETRWLNRKEAISLLSGPIKREVRNVLFSYNAHNEMVSFAPTDIITLMGNSSLTMGFMWGDFIPDNNSKEALRYTPGRGWMYGKPLTKELLKMYSTKENQVRGIFRAHQHNGKMLKMLIANRGIVNLWDGIVHTFLSTPVSYCYFPFDSFGILTTSNKYKDWILEHFTEPINT